MPCRQEHHGGSEPCHSSPCHHHVLGLLCLGKAEAEEVDQGAGAVALVETGAKNIEGGGNILKKVITFVLNTVKNLKTSLSWLH